MHQCLHLLFSVFPTNLVTIDENPIEEIFTLKTITITTRVE